MSLDERRTAVYRLYDADGALLYVGMTCDPETRWRNHSVTKPWWPTVARTALEWHPDRPDAERAEAAAIEAEAPAHNCLHSPVGPDDMPLRDARREFGPLVEDVRTSGVPRWITRHGRRAAVVVPEDFYRRALAALGETPELVPYEPVR